MDSTSSLPTLRITVDSQTYKINVKPDTTVEKISAKISKKTGIDVSELALITSDGKDLTAKMTSKLSTLQLSGDITGKKKTPHPSSKSSRKAPSTIVESDEEEKKESTSKKASIPDYHHSTSKHHREDTVPMPQKARKLTKEEKEAMTAERKTNYKTLKSKYPDISRYSEVKDFLTHTHLLTGDLSAVTSLIESKLSTLTLTETCENVDVVFCVDTTGSMDAHIEAAKMTCKNMVKSLTDKTNVKVVQFAFVAYRDHPPEDTTYVTKVEPLTT